MVDLKISVAAADIIKKNIGAGEFTFSVYPASTPIYMELVKDGAITRSYGSRNCCEDSILWTVLWSRRYSDDNAFSIRHTTRNFEPWKSKLQNGQILLALMDARSIAADSSKQGILNTGNSNGCRVQRTEISL